MNRRGFLATSGVALLGVLGTRQHLPGKEQNSATGSGVAWHRDTATGLFDQVSWDGRPLVYGEGVGLLDGFCRPRKREDGLRETGHTGRQTLKGKEWVQSRP